KGGNTVDGGEVERPREFKQQLKPLIGLHLHSLCLGFNAQARSVGFGNAKFDGDSPKVSNSSPLVSPSTTINMPEELYSIDVVATFGVPSTTVGDLHKLINDIDVGKYDKLLSEMNYNDRM
nr:hypothetical protein [Tanacetum cinerariifolium]